MGDYCRLERIRAASKWEIQAETATKHLSNSRIIFLHLVEKVRTFPKDLERQLIAQRDYEVLELAVLEHLLGK